MRLGDEEYDAHDGVDVPGGDGDLLNDPDGKDSKAILPWLLAGITLVYDGVLSLPFDVAVNWVNRRPAGINENENAGTPHANPGINCTHPCDHHNY